MYEPGGVARRPCASEGRSLEDAELALRAKAGDVGAFEQLVRRHQGISMRVAYLAARGAADVEDVVQEAFVKAYFALDRFRDGAPFRPWLLRIVANEASNSRRAAGRRSNLARDLGPRYEVRWVVTIGARSQTIEQTLYPWGPPPLEGLPTGPWLVTEGGHSVFGQRIGSGWMPAASVFFADLVAAGMPSVAPTGGSVPGPVPDPARAPATWPIVLGGLLLVGLLAAGVAVGRPRRRPGLQTA